jgi:hypothetical protein
MTGLEHLDLPEGVEQLSEPVGWQCQTCGGSRLGPLVVTGDVWGDLVAGLGVWCVFRYCRLMGHRPSEDRPIGRRVPRSEWTDEIRAMADDLASTAAATLARYGIDATRPAAPQR